MLVELDRRNWVRSEHVRRIELRDDETQLAPTIYRMWLFDSSGALILDVGFLTAAEREVALGRLNVLDQQRGREVL